jgi:predicted metalloprotease with PDZ domain
MENVEKLLSTSVLEDQKRIIQIEDLQAKILSLTNVFPSKEAGSLGLALEGCRVTAVSPEGPAEQSKNVFVGDEIIAVNGIAVDPKTLKKAVMGKENTIVQLRIRRGVNDYHDVVLVREASLKLQASYLLFDMIRKVRSSPLPFPSAHALTHESVQPRNVRTNKNTHVLTHAHIHAYMFEHVFDQ